MIQPEAPSAWTSMAAHAQGRAKRSRLLAEPTQPQSVYWRNPRPGHVLHAMLFFTVDGGMIAGLTVSTGDRDLAEGTLRRLAGTIDARYGYTLWEAPPPDTAADFEAAARKADPPRILP